jgi:DNA-binding response OmpR family regulator
MMANMAKILIVDDEEIARFTLAEILRLEGYEIKTVSSGEAAVEALNFEPFDVMVLDLKMSGMSGMDVLQAIVGSLPNLIVIVLTAYGSIDTAIQAIRYRVYDYLLKPASPEQVIESIERALAQKTTEHKQEIASVSERGPLLNSKQERLPGGALLSWDRRLITWDGGALSLTPTEARLLKILFEFQNEMVTHSELVLRIQGYQVDTEEAAKILRPVVSRLRQKLASVPDWNDRIKNVRGAGYVLELE